VVREGLAPQRSGGIEPVLEEREIVNIYSGRREVGIGAGSRQSAFGHRLRWQLEPWEHLRGGGASTPALQVRQK